MEGTVARALAGSTMQTTQVAVSLPRESGSFYTQDRYRMAMPQTTPTQAGVALAIQAAILLGPIGAEIGFAAFANPAAANTAVATAIEIGMGDALRGASVIGVTALAATADALSDGARTFGPFHRLGDSAEAISSIRPNGGL